MADGLASRIASENTLKILRDGLDDFVLVSEAEIRDAVRLVLATTHTVAEGASAASFAAARKLSERLRGRKVGIIHSGSNLSTELMRQILLEAGPP
jgi:threonine dehydratase